MPVREGLQMGYTSTTNMSQMDYGDALPHSKACYSSVTTIKLLQEGYNNEIITTVDNNETVTGRLQQRLLQLCDSKQPVRQYLSDRL